MPRKDRQSDSIAHRGMTEERHPAAPSSHSPEMHPLNEILSSVMDYADARVLKYSNEP